MSENTQSLSADLAELISWDDDRGFGFARLPGGSERIFVHIRALKTRSKRPEVGDRLSLTIVDGKGGRPAAKDVLILGPPTQKGSALSLHLVTAVILMLLLQMGLMRLEMPLWLASIYVLLGGLSLFAYSWDKQAAIFGTWRIRERDLIILDALGGVIGGLLAQHMLRHKRNKSSFQWRTAIIVTLHATLLCLVAIGIF